MEENVCLKLWFKVGCSPRHTQIVPKWHLDGQPAGTDFFNTRAHRGAQKKFLFSPEANFGGFGLLSNGGKRMLQIMVQGGVFCNIPKYYQNGTWMGKWPELIFFQHARAALRAKKVSIFARSEFGRI